MSQHTDSNRTPAARARTAAIRTARAAKRTGTLRITRAGHVRRAQ